MYCPFNGRTQNGSIENFYWCTFPLYSPFMRSIKNHNLKAHFYEVIFSLVLSFFSKALKWSFAKIYISYTFLVENFTLFHLIPMSLIPWYDDFSRKVQKTVENWFFDFSNAICHWMAQNGEKFTQTFFVENFTLFHLIYGSYKPRSYSFWDKCQKPIFWVTVGLR